MCDDSLITLVTKLRLRYEELESLDLTFNAEDAAELGSSGRLSRSSKRRRSLERRSINAKARELGWIV